MKNKEDQIKEILRLAIEKEEQSYELYSTTSKKVKYPNVKNLLIELANEELKHKNTLEKMLKAQVKDMFKVAKEKEIMDLKLTDHLSAINEIQDESSLQELFLFAIKREQSARDFYKLLYDYSTEEVYKNTFLYLAEEESKHKLRLEELYDEVIYENF